MQYLLVFLIGGAFCFIAQILVIKTKLTPTRILILFLIFGAVLEIIGVYQILIDIGGAGAKVPISGFGATIVSSVREQIQKDGIIGIFTGGLTGVSGGISVAIFFSFIIALIFNSKSKNK